MSNRYIVKFIQNVNYPEATGCDAFMELIKGKDNGCPTMIIRTHEESTHPNNKILLNLPVTKNMSNINFSDDESTCAFRSHKIIFDSKSSSAYSCFKNNFEESLNSKFGTEYYPNSEQVMYVGEVLYKENENNEGTKDKIKSKLKATSNTKFQTIKANGLGTLYYNCEGENVKYQGEFSDGNFDGPGKFHSLDGKVVLTTNNISQGIPTQSGTLKINYANNTQSVNFKFSELWKKLGIDSNTKDSTNVIRMKVISDEFVDDVLQVYWPNKNFTIREVKFKELSYENKHLQLFNQINELKTSLDEIKTELDNFNKQNTKLLQTLSNNMLVTVVSVTLAQILLNWYL
jgi:hypothetical protein